MLDKFRHLSQNVGMSKLLKAIICVFCIFLAFATIFFSTKFCNSYTKSFSSVDSLVFENTSVKNLCVTTYPYRNRSKIFYKIKDSKVVSINDIGNVTPLKNGQTEVSIFIEKSEKDFFIKIVHLIVRNLDVNENNGEEKSDNSEDLDKDGSIEDKNRLENDETQSLPIVDGKIPDIKPDSEGSLPSTPPIKEDAQLQNKISLISSNNQIEIINNKVIINKGLKEVVLQIILAPDIKKLTTNIKENKNNGILSTQNESGILYGNLMFLVLKEENFEIKFYIDGDESQFIAFTFVFA